MRLGGLVPGARRIAVLRANGLGDLMFCLPALEALRAAYPEAEIVLLGRALHHELLTGRPGPVDRVLQLPDIPGVTAPDDSPHQQFDRPQQMRRESFDLAIQMHGGGRHSNPFILSLGARVTVGMKTPDAEPLDRWLEYVYYQPEVARYLEVVALAGARPTTQLEPRLAVLPSDLEESLSVVGEDVRPLAVMHPGATDGRRRWPAENFAAVADVIHSAGARVVVTGGPEETELVDRVVSHMNRPALAVAGRLSLPGLTGLLARARLLVSNDTGPLHLAAAVGVPTAGVFWCGNLINGGPFFRWRSRPAISWQLHCPLCGANCVRSRDCGHRSSFVTDVTVEEVVENALSLLASSTRQD